MTAQNELDLENLSDEERAALADEDIGSLQDAEAAAKAAEAADTGDDDPADATATDTPADPAPAAAAEDVTEDTPLAPRLSAPSLEGADEKLAELLDQRKAIREKYREGDITAEEKDTQEDAINDQIADLRAAKQNAAFVESYNRQMEETDYLTTLARVKSDIATNEGLDYDKNPMLLQNWDLKVRALASDPANAGKPGEWYLREAHKQVVAEVEATVAALGFKREGGKAPTRDPIRAAVAERRVPQTGAKSLAALPAAGNETPADAAEFAHLDRLNGDDLETAVARMTPDQQERWARL